MKKPTRGHAVGAGVAAVALVIGGAIGAAVAPNNTSTTTVTGKLMVAVSMGEPGPPVIRAVVRTAAASVPLDVTDAAQAQALGFANDDVHATGTKQDDGVLTVDKIEPATAKSPDARAPLQRTMNVAVVLLNSPTVNEPTSAAQAATTFFGPAPSVADFYRTQSAGQTTMTGQVFGPWPGASTQCDLSAQVNAATAALSAHGVNSSSFTNVVAVTGNLGCPWSGIAWVGSPGVHLNGTTSMSTAAHELGHNFGNWHAGAVFGGALSDYGDQSDVMGSGTLKEFDAWHKWNVGWIPPSSVASQSSGTATYTLTPEETPLAQGTVLLNVTADNGDHLTVEKRAPIGYDLNPNNGSLDHVWVHLQKFQSTDDTIIPASLNGSYISGSFVDSNTTISVLSENPAVVKVCIGSCGTPPPTTTTTPSSTSTSSMTTVPKSTTTITVKPGVQQPPTLTATVQADGTVKVTWTPPNTIARTALQLLRGPSPSHVGTVGTFYLSALAQGFYIDARVPVGTTAYYKARFTTAGTATAWSAIVSVTR